MERQGGSSRCLDTAAGRRATAYWRLRFPACKRAAKQRANSTGRSETSPRDASAAPCCANVPKNIAVQSWGKKQSTAAGLTPSTCTSFSSSSCGRRKESRREAKRKRKAGYNFPEDIYWLPTLPPTDIIHSSTAPAPSLQERCSPVSC